MSVSFPSHTPLNKDKCKNIIGINVLPSHMPLYGYVCRNDVIGNVSLSLSHLSHYTVVRGNAVALVGISSLVSLSRDIYRNSNSAISFLSHMLLNGFICSGTGGTSSAFHESVQCINVLHPINIIHLKVVDIFHRFVRFERKRQLIE